MEWQCPHCAAGHALRPAACDGLLIQGCELLLCGVGSHFQRAPEDRRNVRLTVTPAGLAALPQALGRLPAASLHPLDQDLAEL